MTTPFETYITKVETDLRGGKATEHTYRSSLEILMESFERGIEASNDPKHIECGAPDFIIEKRKVKSHASPISRLSSSRRWKSG